MHHQGGQDSKLQVKTTEKANRLRPRSRLGSRNTYNRDYTMCTVDDHGRGGDNINTSGKLLIQTRRKTSKAGKSRSKVRGSSSSSSERSPTSSASSQEEGIFGILLADEVNKENQHNMSSTPTIGHGLISVIGRRRSMEDAFTVFPNLKWDDHTKKVVDDEEESPYDFFAVFDGHGGHKVSHKCKDRLHQLVAEEVARGGRKVVDWESVMATSFAKMDAEVAEGEVAGGSRGSAVRTMGSTALVVVIGMEEIVVANCGDCRVVLFRDGAALPLSRDHLPERPDEKERVEAAGGNVVEDSDCSLVLGVLSTTRSIGDYHLKPYISSEPEVQICKRSESDDFLVIATDGLWDVMPNDVACDLVRKCFNGQVSKKVLEGVGGSCSAAAATMLAELAIARGSRDNISVIVVQLKNFDADTSSFTK